MTGPNLSAGSSPREDRSPPISRGEPKSVILIGYRATGKSTVGRLLAERLGIPFYDSDKQIEKQAERPIRQIFEEQGEAVFRDWEEQVLAELTRPDQSPCVLATGGGAILREASRRSLRRFGWVVWLRADASILARRLARSARGPQARPALTARGTVDEVHEVLALRTPLYRRTAHLVIDTTERTSLDVARDIAAFWRQRYGDPPGADTGTRTPTTEPVPQP